MTGTDRFGVTVPLANLDLSRHERVIRRLIDLGYTDVWSSEADGVDCFTPLAMATAWEPRLRLGTAIAPAYTRGPALLAQSFAAMAEAAPGRFLAGIGSSSNVIVEHWNSIPFADPYKKTRDVLRFLREALSGERVAGTYDTFAVNGFRLARPPEVPPPLLVAALRPAMLRLAGREGDGAIINWLAASDVPTVAAEVGPGKEIVARIFVAATEDTERVRAVARRMITAYLNVPVYKAFHEWLGRTEVLGPMWEAWGSGDRKAALGLIPDEVVDDLVVHGSPEQCRAHIDRYVAGGVTTPMVLLVPGVGIAPVDALDALAPRSGSPRVE